TAPDCLLSGRPLRVGSTRRLSALPIGWLSRKQRPPWRADPACYERAPGQPRPVRCFPVPYPALVPKMAGLGPVVPSPDIRGRAGDKSADKERPGEARLQTAPWLCRTSAIPCIGSPRCNAALELSGPPAVVSRVPALPSFSLQSLRNSLPSVGRCDRTR